MSYTKLDSKIITSSIWDQPAFVLKCFITFWALCDNEDGAITATKESVFRASNLTREEFDIALSMLLSPDELSKTPDHDGKRILQISNTEWLIVNYSKYRLPESEKKEKHRDKMRSWREKNKNNNTCDVTVTSRDENHCHSPACVSVSDSVSSEKNKNNNTCDVTVTSRDENHCHSPACVSVSDSVSSEEDYKEEQKTFDQFWAAYPKKKSKGDAQKAWSKIKSPVETLTKILTALEWQKKSKDWVKEQGQYIPLPASYIRSLRWEDEKDAKEESVADYLSNIFKGE
jgi:hypothetical protein